MLGALATALGAETGRALRASSWTPSPLRSRPKHIDDVGAEWAVAWRVVGVLLRDDLVGQPGWMAVSGTSASVSAASWGSWIIFVGKCRLVIGGGVP